VRFGVEPDKIEGENRVSAIVWREGGEERRLACDAIGYGFALRSETQLADLAGCRFVFDKRDRAWRPDRDEAGRTSIPGIYIAGDGAGIAGADAAELTGERAALAVLEDSGITFDRRRGTELEGKIAGIQRFRDILEAAFPFPDAWADRIGDDVRLCRCEEVSVGQVRAAVHDQGVTELNRLKALTRVGMGRCQGRMCGSAAAEILAVACGKRVETVGRLRAQPPVKPLPLMIVDEGETA
jgi:NADPH-dependent 2,4-dienoyl-CoA reductase/sulfur reductase-like enzyme